MEQYIENFKKVLQNYANFDGRATRAEYWQFVLVYILSAIGLGLIGSMINTAFLSNIFALAMFVPSLSVGVRRMHDTGKSGWFYLVPLYNLILTLQESEKKDNIYGSYKSADSVITVPVEESEEKTEETK